MDDAPMPGTQEILRIADLCIELCPQWSEHMELGKKIEKKE